MKDFKRLFEVKVEDHIMDTSKTTSDNEFQKTIDKYGLFVLMLNPNGTIKKFIDCDEKYRIIYFSRKIDNLSEKEKESIDMMADEISSLTATLIKVSKEEGENFKKYFRQFVTIELLGQHLTDKISFIIKDGKMLDYKIKRVVQYLNIDLDLEAIKDFEIMYTGNVIKLNGQEYYKRETEETIEIPKTNKIGRKTMVDKIKRAW